MSNLREEIKTLDLPAYIGAKYEYGKRKKLNSQYKTNLVKHTFVPSMTALPHCRSRENTGGSQRLAKVKLSSENYGKSRFHFKGEIGVYNNLSLFQAI